MAAGVHADPPSAHRLAAAVLFSTLLCVGCSISLPAHSPGASDLLLGVSVRKPSAGADRRIVPGLDLRLGGDWEGLGVGWSDVLVVQPEGRDAGADAPQGWHYAAPAGLAMQAPDGTEWKLGWVFVPRREPRAPVSLVRFTELGAQIRWDSLQRGLGVGLNAGSFVRVAPDTDGAFLLRCGSGGIACELTTIELEDD